MHIAIDARILKTSTGRYVDRLLHYLQDVDSVNKYSVLLRAADADSWIPRKPNFQKVIAEFDDYSLSEQLGLRNLLNKLAPDVTHFCMPQQPILYGRKMVTTIHDLTLTRTYNSDKNRIVFTAKQMIFRVLLKTAARRSARVLVPSNYTGSDLIAYAGIDPAKVDVTYEAADVCDAAAEPVSIPSHSFLLYVGQQKDYKNITRLAEAHQSLLPRYPDLGLVLVGKVDKSVNMNMTEFSNRGFRNIHFTGFVNDSQLRWLYENCVAYVFPSTMEGFGLPGLEAMANGAPVLSSDRTCLPEIYEGAASYFDPHSVESMGSAISRVIEDRIFRDSLIEAGSKHVARFSWERMARQTLAAYEKAVRS
jgi:glycosyltransferase involved in cell wall biosynthesis